MVTLTEDYVSFETAKLLKENGFDEKCSRWYVANEPQEGIVEKGFGENQFYINSPTHQMAMKWLREVHGIFICIEFDAPTFVADMYKMDEIDEYGCAKHISPTIANCKTYEEACEAAIKYVLENLI